MIENRPGAGGATGTRSVATADPDGYTLLLGTARDARRRSALVKNPGYDPIKSFAPVAKVSDSTTILVVHPSFPANSIPELIAYDKANPGKLSYASAGVGNQTQLAAELLLARAGIKAVHVPYKSGAEMVTAVLGEQVQIDVSGRLDRARADQGQEGEGARRHQRARVIRNCRTCRPWRRAASPITSRRSGPGSRRPPARRRTSSPRSTARSTTGSSRSRCRTVCLRTGAQAAAPGTPQDFGDFIAAETRKWAAIAKTAGISLD